MYALKHFQMADQRHIESNMHERLCVARMLETLALDRPVDDLLRQVEGQEIRDHRSRNDQQDPNLLQPGVRPNVTR
ncbi:hypothetical protein RHSP_57614 [Rhizobium freirei PRF 81]|uniref:Uncharacterized protein n=1 Tax=Rhizobium freirei PRF 81 TaxID=363754 RepID=N6UTL3_9HYPH|nr:hypothetical protein RHSP_57614 [Rhizobium freirei PRF 81]